MKALKENPKSIIPTSSENIDFTKENEINEKHSDNVIDSKIDTTHSKDQCQCECHNLSTNTFNQVGNGSVAIHKALRRLTAHSQVGLGRGRKSKKKSSVRSKKKRTSSKKKRPIKQKSRTKNKRAKKKNKSKKR